MRRAAPGFGFRNMLVALAIAAAVAATGAQPASTRLLFIGNSLTFWNDGLWVHLERMASAAAPPVAVTTGRSVFPGAFFKSLWERPEPRDAIRSRRYDVVVLQEDLPETRVADFRDHARRFVAEVRQAGARPVLLMAWAYRRLGWITMAEIAQAHREAAAELKVDVAPAGLAWARAMQQRPSLNLYAPDREHPSVAGTYLTTAVVYATVFGKDPSALTYRPVGINSDDGALLRRVAWETVQANRR
jgi:hypothetical protein